MGFLSGKRALIVGLASTRSIAYGISQAMFREGAQLAFACQNEKLCSRVSEMAKEWNSEFCFPCDVSFDEEISTLFTHLKGHWDSFDILVHSLAYAPADQLQGDYLDNVSREGFKIAHDISSYSLAALAKAAKPMMLKRSGSILSLSYLGAERVIQNYNVMGLAKASLEANIRYLAASLGPHDIRVNGVSAGPIRTLAASGIKGFKKMLDFDQKVSPLRKNVSIEQVGNAGAFLCSDLASGITGEILHVDSGFNIMGLVNNE